MSKITFLAGDQDFRPLLDAVVRDGMYVTLMYDKAHTSVDLINMADSRREIDFYGYHNFLEASFKLSHPAPERSSNGAVPHPQDGVMEELGYRGGEVVARLYRQTTNNVDLIGGTVPIDMHWYPMYTLRKRPAIPGIGLNARVEIAFRHEL